jgi:hypothetical protein
LLSGGIDARKHEKGAKDAKQRRQPVVCDAAIDLRLFGILAIVEDMNGFTGLVVRGAGTKGINKLKASASLVAIFDDCGVRVVTFTRVAFPEFNDSADRVVCRGKKPLGLDVKMIAKEQECQAEDKQNRNCEPICLPVKPSIAEATRAGSAQKI